MCGRGYLRLGEHGLVRLRSLVLNISETCMLDLEGIGQALLWRLVNLISAARKVSACVARSFRLGSLCLQCRNRATLGQLP